MATFSHSKLASFEQCPYKYKLKYIYKIKPEIEKSIESHLGSATHDALEWLYIQVLKKQTPELDQVIEKYIETWNANFSDKILIVKKEFTHQDYFDKGIKFIIDYYVKHSPFIDGTLETEKQIWVKLEEDYPHKIIGYIDRLSYNHKKKEYEVHDYKTANWLPDQKKLDQDRQLALYSIGIKQLFGDHHNVNLIWHYLNHNIQVSSRRTPEQLTELKQDIINQIKIIENNSTWNTNKTKLCDWCEYKDYCKEFGNSLPQEFQEKESQQKLL
jgi:RecB family exonuclease